MNNGLTEVSVLLNDLSHQKVLISVKNIESEEPPIESELSYDVSDKWANVTGKVVPALLGEGDWRADIVTNESTVPRQNCIPDPA